MRAHCTRTTRCGLRRSLLAVSVAACFAGEAAALPTGQQTVSGQAIPQLSGRNLTITSTPGAIVNWQSFSIGGGEAVRIQQQGAASAILNRVTGKDGVILRSDIFGSLTSNGRVFLINPAGIAIGPGGIVNTAGFVASSLNIADQDFLQGRMAFAGTGGEGGVVNAGRIVGSRGSPVYLIAPDVENSGTVSVQAGEVILAAGRKVDMVSSGLEGVRFEVQAPQDAARNLGRIEAAGGAIGVFAGTLSHSGVIRADRAATGANGTVVLSAVQSATLAAGSTVSASGGQRGGSVRIAVTGVGVAPGVADIQGIVRAAGRMGGSVVVEGGNIAAAGPISAAGTAGGGSVELRATGRILATAGAALSAAGGAGAGGTVSLEAGESAFSSARIDATGSLGGQVQVTGPEVKLAGAAIDASGRLGGGSVRLGGDFHGAQLAGGADGTRLLPNARSLIVNGGTSIRADALSRGNGGTVVAWSDGTARVSGRVSARGGQAGGDGGNVEISGKESLRFGATVDLTARRGEAGTLLLDPKNIIIVPGTLSGPLELVDPTPSAGSFFGDSIVGETTGGNVVVADPGDDFVAANAGAVYVYNPVSGALLGAARGRAANDQFGGGPGVDIIGNGNLRVYNPIADVGALVNAGTLVTLSGVDASLVGRVDGNAANQQFGSRNFFGHPDNGNLVYASPLAASGAIAGAGAVIMVNGATGSETGRVSGATAGEALGTGFNLFVDTLQPNGNYVIRSVNASNGAIANAGAIIMASGATGVETGRVRGNSLNQRLGTGFDLGASRLPSDNYVIAAPGQANGAIAGAGAVIMASGTTGNELGRVSGNSAGEQLGAGFFLDPSPTGNLLSNGNYIIVSSDASSGALANAGAVILANGASGSELGRVSGQKAGEGLGSQGFQRNPFLPSDDYVIRSPNANNGATVNAGRVILASGTTGLALGSVAGSSANERLGADFQQFGDFLFNAGGAQRYVVRSPDADEGGTDRGTVILVNGTTGSEIGRTSGATDDERFGAVGIDQLFVGGGYVVRSPDASSGGLTRNGASVQIDGATGLESNRIEGANDDERLGAAGITQLFNGNYAVPSPDASSGGLTANGAVVLVDGLAGGTEIDREVGIVDNERLGSGFIDIIFSAGNYIIRSPSYESAIGQAEGRILFTDGTTGLALSTVTGNPGEVLGGNDNAFSDFGGPVLVQSPGGDRAIPFENVTGVQGTDIVGNGAGTTFAEDRGGRYRLTLSNRVLMGDATGETGAISGTSPFVRVDFGIDYLVQDSGADFIAMADGGTGAEKGGAGNGRISGDGVGSSDLFFLPGGNYLLPAPDATNGVGGAVARGAMILADRATGTELGRVIGNADNERLGSLFDPDNDILGSGNYVIRSPGHTSALGLTAAGAVILADAAGPAAPGPGVSNEIGRVEGAKVNEQLGDQPITRRGFLGGDDYIIRSLNADNGATVSAGAVILVNGATGDERGRVSGNSGNEALGTEGIDQAAPGGYIIRSPAANAGAGAVILADFGTGTEVGRIDGATAGDGVGSLFVDQLGNGNYLVRAPLHDGPAVDAGAAILVDGNAGTELGRVSGASAGEQLADIVDTFVFGNDNYLIRSTAAANGAIAGAGAVILTSGTTGSEVGRVSGNEANQGLGQFFDRFNDVLSNNNYVLRGPNATVGALTEAGTAILTSGATGLEISRVNGGSANERLGDSGIRRLANNRYLVPSPDADTVAGVDAGRIFLVDGTATSSSAIGDLLFGDTPAVDSTLGAADIGAFLATGANLTLEANNDIVFQPGAAIGLGGSLTSGSLRLEAGRTVDLENSTVVIDNDLTVIANSASGTLVSAERDPGAAAITMAAGGLLDAGTGILKLEVQQGLDDSGDITAHLLRGGSVQALNLAAAGTGGITTLAGGGTVAQTGIDYQASGAITVRELRVTGTGGVGVTSLGSSIDAFQAIAGPDILASNGAVSLAAAGNLTVNTGAGIQGTTVGLASTAGGSVTLATGTSVGATDAGLLALDPAIVITDSGAGFDILLGGNLTSASGLIQVDAGGDLRLDTGGTGISITAGGDLDLSAGGAVSDVTDIAGRVTLSGQNVTVTAADFVALGFGGGSGSITATAGGIDVNTGTGSFGGCTTPAGGTCFDGAITATGNVGIDASGGTFIYTEGSVTSSAGGVTLISGSGNVATNGVTAATAIDLTSNGGALRHVGTGGILSAPTIDLQAAAGVGLAARPLTVQAGANGSGLSVTNSGAGEIALVHVGNLVLGAGGATVNPGTADPVSIRASGGALSVTSALTTGGDLALGASTTLAIQADTAAGGNLALSGGRVSVVDAVASAGADVTVSAGGLSVVGATAPAALLAAIDMRISAGSLTVGSPTATASSQLVATGDLTIGGGSLGVSGGSAAGASARVAGAAVNVMTAGDIRVTGGPGDGAHAVIEAASTSALVQAGSRAAPADIFLVRGSGLDADAAVTAVETAHLVFRECTGCVELRAQPIGNGTTEFGVFGNPVIFEQIGGTPTNIVNVLLALFDTEKRNWSMLYDDEWWRRVEGGPGRKYICF